MELTVHCTLDHIPGGHVTIPTDPSQTVDSLITAFCTTKGVTHKRHYLLETKDGDILHNTRTIGTCGLNNGDILYLTSENEIGLLVGTAQWWILTSVCLAIGCVGIIAISIVKSVDDRQIELTKRDKHAVVLDAGSTHTALTVYRWRPEKINGTASVHQLMFCKTTKGISSFASNPRAAGLSLKICLDKSISAIPTDSRSSTPVYLAATAGMRLLHDDNSSISDVILTSVRETLKSYPFKFSDPRQQATILTGDEEGVYGWITVNFLKDVFGTNDHHLGLYGWWSGVASGESTQSQTLGALDMGGASTQLTFLPPKTATVPKSYMKTVILYGSSYELYTHSFLCYGRVQAENRLLATLINGSPGDGAVVNPCAPRGYQQTVNTNDIFNNYCTKGKRALETWGSEILPLQAEQLVSVEINGSSDPEKCKEVVSELFNFTQCPYRLPRGSSCSFNQQYIPQLHGHFLAFSFFYFNVEYLNLTKREDGSPKNFTLAQYKNASDVYCSKDFDQVKTIPTNYSDDRTAMCFDSQYLYTMLTKGYHFNNINWNTLTFTSKVDNKDIGWSLGFILNMTNSLPSDRTPDGISLTTFSLLMIVFIVFVILSIVFACKARHEGLKHKGRKYTQLESNDYGSLNR